MEAEVDAWWAREGRAAFIERAKAALADSKVAHILASEPNKEKRAKKLNLRVDTHLVSFISTK